MNIDLEKTRRTVFAAAVLIGAAAISACFGDSDTVGKVDAFTERTEPLLEKDNRLAEEYHVLLEQVHEKVRQPEDVESVIASGLLGQIADNADKALANSSQYQEELKRLFDSLDEESPCHQPEVAESLGEMIAEKKQAIVKLRKLENGDLEDSSSMAIVGTTANASAAGMSGMMEMFKACMVPAAMGMTKSEVEEQARKNNES
ncbi:hypothetical protein [Microbulbifer halophilus]